MTTFTQIPVDMTDVEKLTAIKIAISTFDKASQNIFDEAKKDTDEEIMKAVTDSVMNEGFLIVLKEHLKISSTTGNSESI